MTGSFVRIDVLFSRGTVRRRALSDMLMTVPLLLPFPIIFGIGVGTF